MKDLKHLIYFESLLEDANNELVRRAEAEGDLAIGYTCFHAPEVLLNLGNCFSVRLRAPHTNSMELATYYMANNSCEFSRALLERALEGNYSFLHAMAGVDVCEANNRAIENMEIMHMQGEDKEKFFYCNLDIPYSDDEDCVEHMYDHVSCKNVGGLHGLFEDQARERGIHLIWIPHDVMDPRTVSRREMREAFNQYMITVLREKPLDPTLLDYEDALSW